MKATAENIVQLPSQPKPAKAVDSLQRFRAVSFINPRSGSQSWRVTGWKRDGSRVRENYAEEIRAKHRQIELETEYLQGHVETAIQPTKLAGDQVRLAEAAIVQLGEDWQRLLDAVVYWQQHGKQRMTVQSPRIDDAVDQYLVWLQDCTFRDATKRHWKTRMTVFRNGVENIRVADATPEFIEKFLDGRKVSSVGKDTDKRAISRFFSWCIERPRKWAMTNPCREIKIVHTEAQPIQILTVKQCKALLKAAKREGILPYIAISLYGGVRPFEAARMTWAAVNLTDEEIRLEGAMTKTGEPRTIKICPTLKAWLQSCKGKPFYPPNWRKKFDAVKIAAGFNGENQWPADCMRHTAISAFFRRTGSYGQSAERFGNSEAIIRKHYDGKMSSDDAAKFYALRPGKRGAK